MFLPDNIDLAQSEKYSLSIRLSPNGFSFLILSSADKSIYYYKESIFSNNLSAIDNIKKIFFESNLFTHPFKSISVIVVSPRYTFVPEEFFDNSSVSEYFNFNIFGENGKIISNYIENNDLNIVFDMNEEIYSFLFRSLWNPSFFSFTSQLIPFFSSYGDSTKRRCFTVFHDDMITVLCFDAKKLLSANTIAISNKSDIMYHIVNIWDKHSLDQNNDFLYISGDVEENWDSVNTLKQLIKNVVDTVIPVHSSKTNKNIPTDILLKL